MSDFSLQPNLFADDIKQEATRVGFGRGLKAAGEADEQVVALCARHQAEVHALVFSIFMEDASGLVAARGIRLAGVVTQGLRLGAGQHPDIAVGVERSVARADQRVDTTFQFLQAGVVALPCGHRLPVLPGSRAVPPAESQPVIFQGRRLFMTEGNEVIGVLVQCKLTGLVVVTVTSAIRAVEAGLTARNGGPDSLGDLEINGIIAVD